MCRTAEIKRANRSHRLANCLKFYLIQINHYLLFKQVVKGALKLSLDLKKKTKTIAIVWIRKRLQQMTQYL